MGVLAYRQRGRIDLPAEDTFCSPGVFARIQARKMKKKRFYFRFQSFFSIQDHNDFARDNGLGEPEAGNFFNARYSFATTDRFLCVFSR